MNIGLIKTSSKPFQTPDGTFFLAGKQFPIQHTNKHLLIVGQTGSGKTVSLRLTMQSLLPEIGKHAEEGGYRALLYDPKTEVFPQLRGMKLTCPILLTNPFDVRAFAWALAKDVTCPSSALATAAILIPHEQTMQPFFSDAARQLLYGTMLGLHFATPSMWSLRQVCLVMRSVEYLRQLLGQSIHTRHLVRLYLQEEGKMLQSILSTLATKMMPFEVIAALWHCAEKEGRTFHLSDFVKQEQIIVLGNHEKNREAIDAINRAIVKRLSELLLSESESSKKRTFLILDEIREAGKLDGLTSLLLRGRSFGVACVLSFQSKSGLNAVYSDEISDELTDQCAFKVLLKCDGETAEWAAKQFGDQELIELRQNQSYSYGGEHPTLSQGSSENFQRKQTVIASELMCLPPASRKNGMQGYVKTPWGAYKADYDFASLLCPEDPHTPHFLPRTEQEEYLEDWTDEELARLGLTRIPDDPANINWKAVRQNLFPRDKRKRNSTSDTEDSDND